MSASSLRMDCARNARMGILEYGPSQQSGGSGFVPRTLQTVKQRGPSRFPSISRLVSRGLVNPLFVKNVTDIQQKEQRLEAVVLRVVAQVQAMQNRVPVQPPRRARIIR